jgi:hypothetical protein
MHMSDEKLFSLAEANALIPRLEMLIEQMQRINRRIQQEMELLAKNFNQCAHDLTIAQLLRLKPELQPLFDELSQSVQDIEALGGSLKGLELGLVDFPGKVGGEIVELCWQYGEKEITYYHFHDEGFAGRRPLKPQSTPSRSYRH